tara:strand:- start:1451 stop:1747 length:297 start_codon:yes stop_codon:yes gene_type:complete
MGATTFVSSRHAPTAQQAFNGLVADALQAYGDEGYTGTIAEKGSYKSIECKPANATAMIRELLDDDDHWVGDKWGPAGHIETIEDGKALHIFFGWASE